MPNVITLRDPGAREYLRRTNTDARLGRLVAAIRLDCTLVVKNNSTDWQHLNDRGVTWPGSQGFWLRSCRAYRSPMLLGSFTRPAQW
jgi:hypothetical protein